MRYKLGQLEVEVSLKVRAMTKNFWFYVRIRIVFFYLQMNIFNLDNIMQLSNFISSLLNNMNNHIDSSVSCSSSYFLKVDLFFLTMSSLFFFFFFLLCVLLSRRTSLLALKIWLEHLAYCLMYAVAILTQFH